MIVCILIPGLTTVGVLTEQISLDAGNVDRWNNGGLTALVHLALHRVQTLLTLARPYLIPGLVDNIE